MLQSAPISGGIRMRNVAIFGPVFWYELLTSTRRTRYFIVRGAYALAAVGFFTSLQSNFDRSAGRQPQRPWFGPDILLFGPPPQGAQSPDIAPDSPATRLVQEARDP